MSLALAIWFYRYGGWRAQVLAVPPEPGQGEEHAHATGEPAGRLQPTG